MKRALLVGFGAEIGSTLLGMVAPDRDGFAIDTILTNPIADDLKNPGITPMDSLYARLIMAHPQMAAQLSHNADQQKLIVNGYASRVIFGDCRSVDLASLGGPFDVCIFATSKTQIGDDAIIGRFQDIATYVIGVSEAKQLPALYANLINAPHPHLGNPPKSAQDHRVFAIGSCQSNGWHGPLRALLDLADDPFFKSFDLSGCEVDIVHPDTPTGRLGTKAVEPRHQDPRNNLRPSFSQVEMAMGLLFPKVHRLNSISLRTLTLPPGYQICRFFFRYQSQDQSPLSRQRIVSSFEKTAQNHPHSLKLSHLPLGSRAFEFENASACVLSSEKYLRYFDNPFDLPDDHRVSELIVQSYVNNVRGYCRSVLDVCKHLCVTSDPQVFYPAGGA